MNKEDTKKAAEVMLAFAEGADVEYRCHGEADWYSTTSPEWNWGTTNYRVKPKAPPIYYAVDYSLPERRSACYVGLLYDTPEAAEAARAWSTATGGRVVALQEVVR